MIVVGAILAASTLAFLLLFMLPAATQLGKLGATVRALRRQRDAKAIEAIFQADMTLRHLWAEFDDTLHAQTALNPETGQFEVVAKRSTVPAETFFSTQALVDTPLRTEFFKHLPGIFTGLGIIGTFSGLILGLTKFKVSPDPEVVREGLNQLVTGVHEAFFVSAVAIGLAMAATFIEKMMVTALYRRVEAICQLLDGLYQAGAGEEYLSRLVVASEASAKEAKQLKQSLVEDLKKILEEVTERQVAASAASAEHIAASLVSSVKESLSEPLRDIKDAVRQVSGDQGEAVHKLLADTMTAMTAQMRDLFGGQVSGIQAMQQQTIDAMTQAVGQLQEAVAKMATSGEAATAQMATRMSEAIASMDARQASMDEQVRTLLADTARHLDDVNQQSGKKMQDALVEVTDAVKGAVTQLGDIIDKAGSLDVARSENLESVTRQAVGDISTQITGLIEHSASAAQQMSGTVAEMKRLTVDAADKMNAGADKLYLASGRFEVAGNGVSTVLERSQSLIKQMGDTSASLSGSAATLTAAMADYRATRDALTAMVTELKATIASAKKEAALTADVLDRIERSSQALRDAGRDAEKYLEQVSGVLTSAHQQFGSNVVATLNQMNGEFHRHIERATKSLAGAIEDLEDVFDKIPA